MAIWQPCLGDDLLGAAVLGVHEAGGWPPGRTTGQGGEAKAEDRRPSEGHVTILKHLIKQKFKLRHMQKSRQSSQFLNLYFITKLRLKDNFRDTTRRVGRAITIFSKCSSEEVTG